jgi:hypothetical protein
MTRLITKIDNMESIIRLDRDSKMKKPDKKTRRISLRFLAFSLSLLISILAVIGQANAAAITLGTATNYGLLVGAGQTATLAGSVAVTGNVGIGQNSTLNLSGINVIAGTMYEGSGVTTNNSGFTWATGGTVTQSMSTAISDANNASIAAAALTATAGLTGQGSAISLTNSSLTIKALSNLSENVLTISSLSLLNGTLTFDDNGFTGAKFIINVTGGFSVGSSGLGKSIIQGINGATAADIIFNIEGTGSTVSLTGSSSNSIIGTVLAPSRNVTVGGGGTLTGALMAGINNAGKSYTLQSSTGGFNITDYAYKPGQSSGGGRAPEPSTILLFGTQMVALAAMRRRRPR